VAAEDIRSNNEFLDKIGLLVDVDRWRQVIVSLFIGMYSLTSNSNGSA